MIVTAVGIEDNRDAIQVWDVETAELITSYQLAEMVAFNNLACIEVAGHLAVTASVEHDVPVWHLAGEHARVHVLTGHTDDVETVTCTVVDGRPVVISAGGNDCTVRIWDIDTGHPIGDPLTGHRGHVSSVACTELAGTPVVVTSGTDATIQVWDLRTRERISKALIADVEGIGGLACTTLGGRPIAVGRSWRDASVVVWDLLAEDQLATIRLPAPVQAVTAMHDMIIAGYGWDVITLRHTPDWTR